ncbi:MAG TPA: hypothetical protein VFV94_16530 [Polyangiaceae bacterium]|nr:hypothetical protein [Polyangiaceae bacterium]
MLSGVLLAGCGSDSEPFAAAKNDDSSLAKPDNIRTWANTASALALYANAYQPIAVADGKRTFDDPACPATNDDGTTLSIEGGCTDAMGASWVGRASVKRHADGARELTLEDFGTQKGDASDTRNGEASVRRIEDGSQDFSLSLVHESGVRVTIDYEGHVEGDYDARTVWSGSGTVTREGLLPPVGTLDVTTSAEVVDNDVCGQPASGNTTLTDEDDTVVVTYDGDVDCDDDQAATYTLNGTSKGKITGIACTASPGRTGPEGASLLAIILGVAGLRGRRRRAQ